MKRGPLLVLTSYILWGLLPIFWKLLADVDSLYTLACRVVFSLAVSAALLPAFRAGPRPPRRCAAGASWGSCSAAAC